MSKSNKPKRMFVMAEFETTLNARELRIALEEHLSGHGAHIEKFTAAEGRPATVELLQVDVNASRPRIRTRP